MVSDQQVKRLWRVAPKLSLEVAAAKAGMDAKTARKYLRARRLPSEMQQKHTWRNRPDAFADFWDELAERLQVDPGLKPKTLLEYLQGREPGLALQRIQAFGVDDLALCHAPSFLANVWRLGK